LLIFGGVDLRFLGQVGGNRENVGMLGVGHGGVSCGECFSYYFSEVSVIP
jgi:hypothetical protein